MKCIRHSIKMIKYSKTGLEYCIRCSEIDSVMDELHDLGEWEYTIKDIESYLRGPDKADIKTLLTGKEESNG